MKRKQFSEEQIIVILRKPRQARWVAELCRKHGLSSATSCAWKAQFGGLEVSDARRLQALEDEGSKLSGKGRSSAAFAVLAQMPASRRVKFRAGRTFRLWSREPPAREESCPPSLA